jgi:hypothetical protein
MASTAASIPSGFRRILAWPRVRFTLIVSAAFGLLMGLHAGGVPVFAHPVASERGRIVGEETFTDMIEAGLLGLEINHRDNPEEGRTYLRALAEKHDLIVTGSSDYHGTGKPNRLGENTTSPEMLQRILDAGTGSAPIGLSRRGR